MDLYYKSGALYCKESGETKEYFYEDGAPKTVQSSERAVLYWPNGNVKRKCHFKQGLRHGTDQMWAENGTLVDEGSYENGKAIGVHRRWSKGKLIEEIEYLESPRFNIRNWDEEGNLRLEAIWTGTEYSEKAWDRFQNQWIEKKGFWNGKKLIYV